MEVIIVRHADKLPIENPGKALSAPGFVRSLELDAYFSPEYGDPDVVVVSKSYDHDKQADGLKEATSMRSYQTAGPILTRLAAQGKQVIFTHPDKPEDYKDLAEKLVKGCQGQRVLVIFEHHHINSLAEALGVHTEDLPDWPGEVYDRAYVLSDFENKQPSLEIRDNQYPIEYLPNDTTFADLRRVIRTAYSSSPKPEIVKALAIEPTTTRRASAKPAKEFYPEKGADVDCSQCLEFNMNFMFTRFRKLLSGGLGLPSLCGTASEKDHEQREGFIPRIKT